MTFARVYVNFEFSVNEEFVACGTLVETLAILKSSCAKGCYLIQNLNLYLVGCICPNVLVINFFKDLVSHTQQKKCYIFSKSNYERKHLLPKHWGKYTLSIGCLSFVSKNIPWKKDSSELSKSCSLFHTQQIFLLPIISILHMPWQKFLFPGLW